MPGEHIPLHQLGAHGAQPQTGLSIGTNDFLKKPLANPSAGSQLHGGNASHLLLLTDSLVNPRSAEVLTCLPCTAPRS